MTILPEALITIENMSEPKHLIRGDSPPGQAAIYSRLTTSAAGKAACRRVPGLLFVFYPVGNFLGKI